MIDITLTLARWYSNAFKISSIQALLSFLSSFGQLEVGVCATYPAKIAHELA